MTNATATEQRDLAIFRSARSLALDALAREQAVLNRENETDMSDEDAAFMNAASFRNKRERNFFKNQYRRHVRNIAKKDAEKNQLFERIAQACLGVPTLRERGRDALDFHDVHVRALLEMMSRAYDAGLQAGNPDSSKEVAECHQ